MATVDVIDGQVVLDDPEALAMVDAIAKLNCRNTRDLHADRIQFFKGRMAHHAKTGLVCAIVIANVDDRVGGPVANILMPHMEAEWTAMRLNGMVPFARGLVERKGIQHAIEGLDPPVAVRLAKLTTPVIVFDHGTVEVFECS